MYECMMNDFTYPPPEINLISCRECGRGELKVEFQEVGNLGMWGIQYSGMMHRDWGHVIVKLQETRRLMSQAFMEPIGACAGQSINVRRRRGGGLPLRSSVGT